MKLFYFFSLVIVFSGYSVFAQNKDGQSKEVFHAEPESLQEYVVPEWYKDAKFGYWTCWGVYSVPAYEGNHASEWYMRWMYYCDTNNDENSKLGLKTAEFHREHYGNPKDFGYKDLAPLFKAEKWDPDAWADLFVEGGAKFFTMMGTFCDNYAMWDSENLPFNSVNIGPKRDLVGEIKEAVKKRGLYFGVSSHSAWNDQFAKYNHLCGGDADSTNIHIYGTGKADRASVERWWNRTTELAEKYQPDLFWFDWCWNGAPYTMQDRMDLAAFYYNDALKWNKAKYPSPGVVLTYKNRSKMPVGSGVLDLERGGMKDIEPRIWMNDTSLGLKSWGYAPNEEYRSANQVIDMLMDIISKNGILLLNIGPKADGTIPPEAKIPILKIGKWLKTNGEAVYATRPWEIFGEGPTVPSEKMHGDQVEYTSEDIRFTRSKDNKTLYVTFLGFPERAIVPCLKELNMSELKKASLLSNGSKIGWVKNIGGLLFKLPKNIDKDDYAYVIKLEFKKEIPSIGSLKQ